MKRWGSRYVVSALLACSCGCACGSDQKGAPNGAGGTKGAGGSSADGAVDAGRDSGGSAGKGVAGSGSGGRGGNMGNGGDAGRGAGGSGGSGGGDAGGAPPTGSGDWAIRSTGPGVIWAHDFTSDEELNVFIRSEDPSDASAVVSNPTPNVLPNGLTLGPTPFGSSRAIVSRAVGTTLAVGAPAASDYPAHDLQVWTVTNAASLPDPRGQPYRLLVGDGGDSGGIEWVEVDSIDVAKNTATVRRKMTTENGGYGTSKAPAYPAGFTVGRGPQGSWNRPFAAFPARQNGKSTPDIGIANGSVTRARTWDTTRNGSTPSGCRRI